MRFLILLLAVFGSLCAGAQQISGEVWTKNKPLSFASVYIKNTNIGTIADVKGKFELVIAASTDSISFYATGYASKTVAIQDFILTNRITLSEKAELLDEVMINTDNDLGRRLIKKAIQNQSINNYQNNDFSAKIYVKSTLHKTEEIATENITVQQNFIEKSSNLYFQPNNNWLEIKQGINDLSEKNEAKGIFSSDFGGGRSRRMNQGGVTDPRLFYTAIEDGNFNFYNGLIYLPKLGQMPFISPVSGLGLLSYKFDYIENFRQGGRVIHKIKVRPIRREEALFTGEIMLVDSSWAIAGVNLSLDGNVLHYYSSFNVYQEYYFNDSIKTLKRQEFAYAYKKLSNTYNGKAFAYFYDYNYSDKNRPELPENLVNITDDGATSRDSAYWNSVRKIELKQHEKKFILLADSIQKLKQSEAYQIKEDQRKNKVTFSNVVFDGIDHYNTAKGYKWRIMPLIQQARFLGVGGYRHAIGGTFVQTPKSYKALSLDATLNYGFNNKDLLADGRISKTYAPKKFAAFEIAGGSKYQLLTYMQDLGNILSRSNFVKNNYLQLGHYHEVFNGLYLDVSAKFMERKSISGLKLNSWSDNLFGDTNPIAFEDYNELNLKIKLSYTPFQKYALEEKRKIIKGSLYPAILAKWEQGIPNVFNSTINYQLLEFGLNQSIKMGVFGVSKYLIYSGQYLHTQHVELPNYMFFRGTDEYFFSHPLYTLQLLSDTYSTLSQYTSVNYIHHFHGSVIKKLPLLKRTKIETVAGGGYLHLTKESLNHSEVYFGGEYPFRIADTKLKFGVYYAVAYSNYSNLANMVKFGINLFNPFTSQWAF